MLVALLTLSLERQDRSCTYLAHHELESNFVIITIIIITITTSTTVTITIIVIIIVVVITIVNMQWQEVPPSSSPWVCNNMM